MTADEKERLKRIMERDGISEQDARVRMSAQKDQNSYIEKSDIIIRNDDLENTRKQIDELF